MMRSAWRRLTVALAIRENVSHHPDLKIGIRSFVRAPHQLRIGREVSIGSDVWVSCDGEIGNGVLIANQVGIVSRDEHSSYHVGLPFSKAPTLGDLGYEPPMSRNSIVIESDVWVGFNATVLSGVRICRGAIVAAGSVVTRDVPPYSIVAGNPAKVVSSRNIPDVAAHEAALDERWRA